MNSFTHNTGSLVERQRQQLERTFRQETQQTVYDPSRLLHLLSRAGQAMVHWLTAGDAPRIRLITQGDVQVWRVYDPVDNRTHYFDQEADVRDWLDQRFYQ